MILPKPDRRTRELDRIWHLLTIQEQYSWLLLARAMGIKQTRSDTMRLIYTALILALALMWTLPFSLRSTILAISAGYVLAVNVMIVKVCFEGVVEKWSR